MQFTLNFAMDNAAFDSEVGPGSGTEAADILEKVARKLDGIDLAVGYEGIIFDSNGANVGKWVVTE